MSLKQQPSHDTAGSDDSSEEERPHLFNLSLSNDSDDSDDSKQPEKQDFFIGNVVRTALGDTYKVTLECGMEMTMREYLYGHIIKHLPEDRFVVEFINGMSWDLKASMLDKRPRIFGDYYYKKINTHKKIPKKLSCFNIDSIVSAKVEPKILTDSSCGSVNVGDNTTLFGMIEDIIDDFVCFVVFSNGAAMYVYNKKMKMASNTDTKKYYDVCKKMLEEYRKDLYTIPLKQLDDGDHNAFKDYPNIQPPKYLQKD